VYKRQITDDFNFAGSNFNLFNNSSTTFTLKTLAISNSSATVTIENQTNMSVTSTLNLTNGTGQFKNTGTLTVNENYNSSSTSTYVNCGTYNGKFNLNSGGKVLNTGTFNTSQMDYGGSTSRIENYGYFNISGNVNLGGIGSDGKGSVFYNEGLVTFNSTGIIQSDGNLVGPSGSTKKGYFVWSNQAAINSGNMGPNLNFRNPSGTSSKDVMFGTNKPNVIIDVSDTWGAADPGSLPIAACPNADGKPGTPIPTSTSVCSGQNLTLLQPSEGGVIYEWWTGSTSSRTTQITTSTTPSVTNYTTTGTVYLWAKNVSSGVYSNAGSGVTVNALPSTPTVSSSSVSNSCPASTVNLTSLVTSTTPLGGSIYYKTTNDPLGTNVATPTAVLAGTYYIFYSNSTGCFSSGRSVTVTINNCPPVAVNDAGAVNENSTLLVAQANGVISNSSTGDADPNGDVLTVTAIRTGTEAGSGTAGTIGSALNETYGILTIAANGSYTYAATRPAVEALAAGATAIDYFTYTVSDSKGGTDVAQLTITITGVNDAPTAVNDAGSVNEDATLTVAAAGVLINDTDPDTGATKIVTSIRTRNAEGSGTAGTLGTALTGTYGILTLNANGSYTYVANNANTLAAGATAHDYFNYTMSDGTASDIAIIDITITGINDAPVAVNNTATTTEDTPISFNIVSNDTDVDGTIDATTVDLDPATSGIQTTLTVSGQGTYTVNTSGVVTFTPVANYNGTATAINYTAKDNSGVISNIATIMFTVSPVNDSPIAINDVNTTFINTVVSGRVMTNDSDPDSDPLSVTAETKATTGGGSVTLNANGSYTYTPATGFTGEESFTYLVCDNYGACDSATVTIEVLPQPTPGNDAPVAVNDAYKGIVNTAVTGKVIANDFDMDGDALTLSSALYDSNGDGVPDAALAIETPTAIWGINTAGQAIAAGSLIQYANGDFSFVPNTGFIGQVTYNYTISDGNGKTDDATVTIDIIDGNSTYAVDDVYFGLNVTEITGNLLINDTDPENDVQSMSTSPVTQPTHGTVVLHEDGTFTYTPDPDFIGTDQFIYEIYDTENPPSRDSATVYITCLLYTSPSPRDRTRSRMPSSA
jgi:VCBS repeat-containing protein